MTKQSEGKTVADDSSMEQATETFAQQIQDILDGLTRFDRVFAVDTFLKLGRELAESQGEKVPEWGEVANRFRRDIEASAVMMVVSLERAAKNLRRKLELRRGLPMPSGSSPRTLEEAEAFLDKANKYVQTGSWGEESKSSCYPSAPVPVKERHDAFAKEYPDTLFDIMVGSARIG